jgi:uncharacterized protein YidB (DUF937 family)
MSTDLLGTLLKGLAGGGASGETGGRAGGGVLESVLDMLGAPGADPSASSTQARPGGALGDLINGFQNAGMGDIVSSWIGTGSNMPVSPEQIERGLGRERVERAAQQSGLSLEALLPVLAAALPTVIDALTPKGEVPEQASLRKGLESLRSRLG